MIEYPSIIHYNKAPRKECIAFDKLDGSNIRIKWTHKKGFCLFGSRTQLIDQNHPFLGDAISYFKEHLEEKLWNIIDNNFKNEQQLIFFGEAFGTKSFAGWHEENDPKKLVLFDILVGKKNRKFVLPREFIQVCSGIVEIPRVVYQGNLNDSFINKVKTGEYDLDEGVVCKGMERTGAYRGHVWMCKIKTNTYLEKLKKKFGNSEFKKYW